MRGFRISVPGLEVVIRYWIADSRIIRCNVDDEVGDSQGLQLEVRLKVGANKHVYPGIYFIKIDYIYLYNNSQFTVNVGWSNLNGYQQIKFK